MKRIFTILMALMALCFTQCKPTPEGGEENDVRKVKIRCEIPINKGDRSDFTNLLKGKINWSDGRECVYLAIHGDKSQIIELESWSDGNQSRLEFEGEAAEGLIVSGQEYDVWYFGHSQQLETPYINNDGEILTGSISTQSGRLEDLGYCHIAKTQVTAITENAEVKLNLNGMLESQIAIALLDLENVTELYGDAIVGTEYALEYDGDRFELNVTEDNKAKINVESATGISYVVLLPNANKETKIKHKKEYKTYAYTFHNYIKSNKIYHRTASDGATVEALKWEEIEEIYEIDGHAYVDLGLPSGLLWATCNVGAKASEEYGDNFAWGETSTKDTYAKANSQTSGKTMNDITGNAQYDAATANWGGSWRMPTLAEMSELRNNCTWTWTTHNGVKGYKVTGPSGASIFLPAAGYKDASSFYNAGTHGYYWSSTPYADNAELSYYLRFTSEGHSIISYSRYLGMSVRPVYGGGFEGPEEQPAQYAKVTTSEVTDITSSSATCGGNVTTDNGSAVTARGICWSTSQNPTINDSKTTDGSGVGSFTSRIPNLVPNTQYYVRAYATNAAGTSYGEEVSFTTLAEQPGDSNSHEYVDLGLSVKWATCNVGANKPEDYGNYYAWGETTTKDNYSSSNCPTYGLSISELQSQGYIDSNGNLTARYDAARANWGGSWRMPTYDELNELLNNCTWTWTTQNGVNGYKVKGPNGNSIFLPAAGYRYGSSLDDAGSGGYYWSSTPHDSNDLACSLYFYSDGHSMYYDGRGYGQSVRPVLE